jgi:hypothetical protein
MKNDALIRVEGMAALMEKLGLVEAERFVMLIQQGEPFDYTRWRENQFNDKNLETVFAEASALRTRIKRLEKAKTAPSPKSKAAAKPSIRRKSGKQLVRA